MDNITVPGMLWVGFVRSPFAHAGYNKVGRLQGAGHGRRRRGLHGADGRRVGRAARSCAWPAAETQDERRTGRSRRTRPATSATASPSWSRSRAPSPRTRSRLVDGRLGAAAGRDRPLRRRMADGAPSCTTTSAPTMSATWGFERATRRPRPAPTRALLRGPRPREGQGEYFGCARLIPNAMEPRGVAGRPEPRPGRVHDVHGLARSRTSSAPSWPSTLRHPEAKMRVIAPDVGGGFGSKLEHYAEEAIGRRRRPASSGAPSSGRRSAPRATSPPSTGATSTATSSWRRRATGT